MQSKQINKKEQCSILPQNSAIFRKQFTLNPFNTFT